MDDGTRDVSGALPDPSASVSVGAALTQARLAAGLSVDQVSAETRIRATVVRDLEADRFASSGGAVYARGHLRAIATAVGAVPGPLVARFDAEQHEAEQRAADHQDAEHHAAEQRGNEQRRRSGQQRRPERRRSEQRRGSSKAAPPTGPTTPGAPLPIGAFGGSTFIPPMGAAARERRGPRWGPAVVAAALAMIVVTVIGYAQKPTPRTPATLGAPTTTSAPTPSTPVVHTPAPGAVAAKPPPTGAQLRVRLIGGTSWVSVSNATTTLFEGVLAAGQFKDFSDPNRLKVILGNAGAVDLNCGGKDGGQAGGSGKVLRFSCTRDGLAPA